MRPPSWLFAVAGAVLTSGALSGAPAEGEAVPSPSPLAAVAPAAAILRPPNPHDHPWRADLLVGLPVGALWLEAGASLYVIVPAGYAAARFDIHMSDVGEDSFHIGPGLGFGVTPGHTFEDWAAGRSVVWGIGDVDFVWRHRWREGLYGEFGYKLGVVVPTGVRDVIPVPRAALLFGVQF